MFNKREYQNREWLYNKYWIEKLSQHQIAKLCEVSNVIISMWMKKFNISCRSLSEADKNIPMEIRKKMGSHKEQTPWNKGISHNQETKDKISESKKGKIPSEKTKNKISKSLSLLNNNICYLNKKAIEFINGELLGDAGLKSYSQYSAVINYSSKYKEYIQHIDNILKLFGINRTGKIREYYYKDSDSYSYQYSSRSYKRLLLLYKKWYPGGKKIVPKDIELTPLTCRQWYIGDGCFEKPPKGKPRIILCTNGFPISDVEWLVNKLMKLGFKTTRQPNANTIYISPYSTKDFLDYIGKCPVKCYQYKWAY